MTSGLTITLGLWMKTGLEERFLREELGPDHDACRMRGPMLMPPDPKAR